MKKEKPNKAHKRMSHFPSAERNEVSTQNPISSENILQELRGNQDILRWRETKNLSPEM